MPSLTVSPARRRAALAALALAAAPLVVAQTSSAPATTAAPADAAQAEIRKIDRDPLRLTLRHGETKSLDMPPMTMVFRVQPPTLADGLKVGDKLRFRAEKAGSDFAVTWIEVVP
jgi:Cu/Ag efflux protein CusF